jgi:hypothetical protein
MVGEESKLNLFGNEKRKTKNVRKMLLKRMR